MITPPIDVGVVHTVFKSTKFGVISSAVSRLSPESLQ
jgi:hypothetical protein